MTTKLFAICLAFKFESSTKQIKYQAKILFLTITKLLTITRASYCNMKTVSCKLLACINSEKIPNKQKQVRIRLEKLMNILNQWSEKTTSDEIIKIKFVMKCPRLLP